MNILRKWDVVLHILESHDLVLHERDEGGYHYHHLAPEHCRVLVAQALAKTYTTPCIHE